MTIATQIAALQQDKSDIATAITNKGGTVNSGDGFDDFATDIATIPTGGTIDSLTITPTTSQQTISASGGTDGYSPITVNAVDNTIDANIQASNIKSGVSILGVSGNVVELNGETLNVTPSTSAQTIAPTSPKNGFTEVNVSEVTSSIDANITAGNIKSGVSILGVMGNYSGGGRYSELPSYQVSSGVASKRTTLTGNEFDNITSVAEEGMAYCFYNGSLSGYLNMPNVTSIGSFGLNSTFYKCGITSARFGNLISVEEFGLQYAFQNCTNILNVYFDKLNILGNYALFDFLRSATNIENVYFNSLTTSTFSSYNTQFNNMLRTTGNTKKHTLHFPSNLSSTIAGLSGYPTFGGTSSYVVLAFDLPATS